MFVSDKTKTNSGFNPDLLSNQFEEDKWLLLVSFIYWKSRYNNICVTCGKSMLCYTSVYVKNVYTHMVNICLELMFNVCCKIARGSHTIHMSYTYVWSQHLWNIFGTFCCVVRQLTGMLTSKRESINKAYSVSKTKNQTITKYLCKHEMKCQRLIITNQECNKIIDRQCDRVLWNIIVHLNCFT